MIKIRKYIGYIGKFVKSKDKITIVSKIVREIKMHNEYKVLINRSKQLGVNYKKHEKYEISFKQASIVKNIALYLPQFHSIPENNEWWGQNFTEWQNVVKAVPQYEGEHQPQLPVDLGFYDLTQKKTWLQQIEMAKNYGLYGFCYYFYWFNGRRILEKPLDLFLFNQDLDMPFCLFWANDSWVRTWHGFSDTDKDESRLLLEQNHNDQDDTDVMIYLCENAFNDSRYIKINNKPVFILYHTYIFQDIKRTTNKWRTICKSYGFDDLYLMHVQMPNQLNTDPCKLGFDAMMQFSPLGCKREKSMVNVLNDDFHGETFSYKELVNDELNRKFEHPTARGCFMSWDNEARRPTKGISYTGSSPELFERYLKSVNQFANKNRLDGEALVFLNAWNEWAEGAHLEPDREYGYAWLKSLYNVVYQNNFVGFESNTNADSQKVTFKVDECFNDELLSFRFVINYSTKLDAELLKRYCLNVVLVDKLINLAGGLKAMLYIKNYAKNNYHSISKYINSSQYYCDTNKKKVIVVKIDNKPQLEMLHSDFPDVRFVCYHDVIIDVNRGDFPNLRVESIHQQIIKNSLHDKYGFCLIDIDCADFDVNKSKFGLAIPHSLYNYQKRFIENLNVFSFVDQHNAKFIRQNKSAMIIHCYYLDLSFELLNYLQPLKDRFDFFISVPASVSIQKLNEFILSDINIKFDLIFDNKGRDISPFINRYAELMCYEWVLKIHTKKSLHRGDGNLLRDTLWNELFNVDLSELDDKCGMVAPNDYKLDFASKLSYMALNIHNMKALLSYLNIETSVKYFIAGSMFWFRPNALEQLSKLKGVVEFPFECGQNDGEVQHAIERIFSILVEHNGYYVKLV